MAASAPPALGGTVADEEGRARAWEPLAAALLLPFPILWLALALAHPDLGAASRAAGYAVLFNALPGLAALAWCAGPGRPVWWLALLALPAGFAANLCAALVGWALGSPAAPVLALAPLSVAALALAHRRGWRAGEGTWIGAWPGFALAGASALPGVATAVAGDVDWAIAFHSGFQAVVARGLEAGGWPPPNLLLPGVGWSYNYGAHLWVLAAERATGVPLDALVARHAPVLFAFGAVAAMVATGRRLLGLSWWAAGLALVGVFWVFGIPPVAGRAFATFLPAGGVPLLSPFLALALFFVALGALAEEGTGRPGLGRAALLATLLFLLTGARAVAPPVLICAAGLHLAVAAARGAGARRLPWREAADVAACLLGFALGVALFFAPGGEVDGLGFARINPHPFDALTAPDQYLLTLPHLLMGLGLPRLASGALAFAAIALFQASFLLPALPAGLAGTWRSKPAILLAGAAFAGACAAFFAEAPGYSHLSFLHFTNAALCLLGALGAQRLLRAARGGGGGARAAVPVLALVAALFLVHVAQFRGPGLAWMVQDGPRRLAAAVAGGEGPGPAVGCLHPADEGLVADAARRHPGATVILIPRQPGGAFYCQTFWALARTGAQGMSNYALVVRPGRAGEGLGRVLAERAARMAAAIAAAGNGALATAEIAALAATVPGPGEVFALAERGVAPDAPGAFAEAGQGERFALWRVR